ncbi:MAG: CBO0543 family protein [Bacillota bacterium]|nr:CBO0543 family protein [Bacillota bacterium]
MHILLAAFLGVIGIFKIDWRNWRLYHTTVLYMVCCNLLYNVLCVDKYLWKYHADFLIQHKTTELIYSFFILPLTALLFLSNFPHTEGHMSKKIWYILKWIFISLAVETIYVKLGRLELMNGYKFWMEPFFYLAMYFMLKLHQSRPLLTYGLSIVIIAILLRAFHIPIR